SQSANLFLSMAPRSLRHSFGPTALQRVRVGPGDFTNGASLPLDQLDLVAVRVLDEGDDASAMLHRPRRTRDLDAFLCEIRAGTVKVGHADSEMAEAAADGIGLLLAPIMGQLDHRIVVLVAIADEGQRELAAGIVLAPQQLHAEVAGIEIDRFLQVED